MDDVRVLNGSPPLQCAVLDDSRLSQVVESLTFIQTALLKPSTSREDCSMSEAPVLVLESPFAQSQLLVIDVDDGIKTVLRRIHPCFNV
jgi:hypothetical protein